MKKSITLLTALLLISCGTRKEIPIIIGYYNENGNSDEFYCDSIQRNNYGITAFKDGLKIELSNSDFKSIAFNNNR